MNGIELAKKYYEAYGIAMLEEQFGNVSDRIAIGLVGEGSECLGYDDAFSQDHDFEPGFCLWITAADERKFGFKLERAYTKLPKTFLGYTRFGNSKTKRQRHNGLLPHKPLGKRNNYLLGTARLGIGNNATVAI